ncbi:MAG: hypothetical protein CSYNP_01240 [Syntrophus sp. SKADARSKE-3]|nr:hypothetical protein [Syntrophus sp. SKADARSKE-3]
MALTYYKQIFFFIVISLSTLFLCSPCPAKEDTAHLVLKKTATTAQHAKTFTYTIKNGDHLLDIVKNELGINKNRLSIIKKYNPQIKNINLIYPGQKIFLPSVPYKSSTRSVNAATTTAQDIQTEKGFVQSGTMIPTLENFAVMQTVLQRMNATMMTSGRYVIPLPEIGQITVDCEMMPMIEFDDGSIVFMDYRKQMPDNIKKLIRKYWKNYTVIAADIRDGILPALANAVNASKAYAMRKQTHSLVFGQKPTVRLPIDWLITGQSPSSRGTNSYMQAIITIRTEDGRLPATMVAFLAKKQFVYTEILDGKVLPSLTEVLSENASEKIPQLNSSSRRRLVLDFLGYLGFKPVTDEDVQIFNSTKDGFNLSMKADIRCNHGNQRVIYSPRKVPNQFIDILKTKSTEVVILSEDDTPKAVIEKNLTAFRIPFTTVPYQFSISLNPDLAGVKVVFPTIRFVSPKGDPVYLIDFNMEDAIYRLLHNQLGFDILRY